MGVIEGFALHRDIEGRSHDGVGWGVDGNDLLGRVERVCAHFRPRDAGWYAETRDNVPDRHRGTKQSTDKAIDGSEELGS